MTTAQKTYRKFLREDWKHNEVAKIIFVIGALIAFLFAGLWFFTSVINEQVMPITNLVALPLSIMLAGVAHWLARPIVKHHYSKK